MILSRRAQAAMEFLMSYGWAILVVLVVIGALAYFGVLSPQKLLPDKCVLPPGTTCDDYSVGTNSISIVVGNGLGKSITITNVAMAESASGVNVCQVAGPIAINNGAKSAPIVCNGNLAAYAGSKTKFNVNMAYTFVGSTLPHTIDGEIFAMVPAVPVP